ncbi:MAG: hypothetical protein JRN42_08565, partial [Nitrososphaerota archaeon]|nr:hypothetical protein [Nitrososphaerota archaeon]
AEAVSMGYRLALDDYSGPSSHDRLGPLAAFVKVDVLLTGPERLAEVVAHARGLADRAGGKCRIFAPVNIAKLDGARGVELAKSRIREGADYLLAQPPTVDAGPTLRFHEKILSKLGLKDRVIPNVFPFRDPADIEYCRKRFGWSIPPRMDEIAKGGEAELLKEAKKAAAGLAESGFSGVYVSTRGRPELARFILD